MNKFEKLISTNSDVTLQRRAGILSNESKMAQEDIIATIKRAINQEELTLMSLTDFAPTHTTSLQPGNFVQGGATEWAQNLQKCKENIYNLKIKLKIAEETYNEYFTEETTEEA